MSDIKKEKELSNLCTNYANGVWNNNQELDYSVEKAMGLEKAIWEWHKQQLKQARVDELEREELEVVVGWLTDFKVYKDKRIKQLRR